MIKVNKLHNKISPLGIKFLFCIICGREFGWLVLLGFKVSGDYCPKHWKNK